MDSEPLDTVLPDTCPVRAFLTSPLASSLVRPGRNLLATCKCGDGCSNGYTVFCYPGDDYYTNCCLTGYKCDMVNGTARTCSRCKYGTVRGKCSPMNQNLALAVVALIILVVMVLVSVWCYFRKTRKMKRAGMDYDTVLSNMSTAPAAEATAFAGGQAARSDDREGGAGGAGGAAQSQAYGTYASNSKAYGGGGQGQGQWGQGSSDMNGQQGAAPGGGYSGGGYGNASGGQNTSAFENPAFSWGNPAGQAAAGGNTYGSANTYGGEEQGGQGAGQGGQYGQGQGGQAYRPYA